MRTSRCRARVALAISPNHAPIDLIAVSPRKTRRPRPAAPAAPLGPERIEEWPDGDWVVRPVPGAAATKAYRCPGCDQELYPGTAHVVVWPTHAGVGVAAALAHRVLAAAPAAPPRLTVDRRERTMT